MTHSSHSFDKRSRRRRGAAKKTRTKTTKRMKLRRTKMRETHTGMNYLSKIVCAKELYVRYKKNVWRPEPPDRQIGLVAYDVAGAGCV